MFKELRALKKLVAGTAIQEPTLSDPGSGKCVTFVGVLDDPELQRLHTAYHDVLNDVSEHATCLLPIWDENEDVSEEDKAQLTAAGLQVGILRDMFHFALKMRFSQLVAVDDSSIWVTAGWKVFIVNFKG